MRVAVISDIHGNLAALETVLAAIDFERVDAIWCLGDTVGYAARPNECCALVRERCDIVLAGNHDLVVSGALGIEEFSLDAALAAAWARERLDEEHRAFLNGLRSETHLPNAGLFHASPRDPVWEYVLSEEVAAASLAATEEPFVLVGHSHVALAIAENGSGPGLAPARTEVDLAASRWLLNPGSVGQPRDGDPQAAWLLIDGSRAIFRRERYDVARTQAEIREAGLPEGLARRLERGE
ncbi:MAG: metallophosphoesterase family protein [Gaiellaceae bacterium]